MKPASPLEQRVLLRMATARDAAMTHDVLARAAIEAPACATMQQMCDALPQGAGALLVAEEALQGADRDALAAALAAQPPWSDVGVLLLARQGAPSGTLAQVLGSLPNATVIERPVRVAALVSAVRATLRARQRQYEVRSLLEDLRQIDRRRSEFLATLAHELRNPLAPIRNTLEVLSIKQVDPATADRYHALMRRQVNHIVRLVDDLMEVSRITRGKLELKLAPLMLDAVIADAVEQSRPLLEAGGHALTVHPGGDALQVNGDAIRLTQVFSNLLNNAAKYTPVPGRISVSARREGSDAVVAVEDTGVGIAADALDAVFELFVQLGEAAKAAQGGLGIGLTLVRNLVEMHGGRVSAASAGVNRGATFTVRLPLVLQPLAAAGPPDHTAARPDPAVQRTVLVVDDNRDAADSLTELLNLMGATAMAAYSGEHALRLAGGRNIDVAVLDIGMPGMDGCDLARRLRTQHGPTTLTLIALTGWGQDADVQRLAAAGFQHHLLKPVDASRLAALL